MKDLTAKFSEVERRVRTLVDENGALRVRAAELEQELAAAKREAESFRLHEENRRQLRERLSRVLRTLEAVEADGDGPAQEP